MSWDKQLNELLASLEEVVVHNFEMVVPKHKVQEVTMTYLCHLEEEKTIILDSKTGAVQTMLLPDEHTEIVTGFKSWLTEQLE